MVKIKCSCSGVFQEKEVEFEGFDVKALKCSIWKKKNPENQEENQDN